MEKWDNTDEDHRTSAFFDENQPTYSPSRLDFVVKELAGADPESRLIDIGAGDGENLRHILDNTPLTNVVGLDVSGKYMERLHQELGCEALTGSILDPDFVALHEESFDYAVIAAVLHHIVGDTRAVSRDFAQEAVKNALRLLRPDGKLFIYEPCYEPRQALTGVFWIKRILSKASPGRLELGRSWMNFGEPIVSYYGPQETETMVRNAGGTVIENIAVRPPKKLGGVIKRSPVGFVVTR